MKQINLPFKIDRDIVFFDLETTGRNPFTDRIVEISAAKVKVDGSIEIKTKRINPQIPIPPSATAIHGISDDDVKDSPTFKAISTSLFKYLDGCDLGGYNALKYDIPLLSEEFKRAGINSFSLDSRRIIDPQIIFHKMEPRDLSAALKFYCGKELNDAHSSEADITATIEVFLGQLKKYQDIFKTLDDVSKFCSYRDESWIDKEGKIIWLDGEAVINFGKKQGVSLKTLSETEPDFLKWMLNASFSDEVKQIVKDAIIGKFPEKK
ncbi:MAG TPA: 3'-5' exonuclease [Victivallales bacterium]|nr:3'-5' exonuclease [Victivallales bacterium]HRR06627.1 3'-5' exonuclease [Victivallales bacterium]HRR28550.1 3'-5' exonuclease [Victivallales bacterium]HRU01446.1 3'-5' exonuclease [Victivallales bacterium]